jgi:shikimate kinase
MKTSIALIGFMGTGKTAVGKALAERLDKEFVELDSLIEQKAGKTIPEIFNRDGEVAFRELEIEVTREVAERKNTVIACGGGVVLNEVNIERLRKECIIVYLTASPRVILKRTLSNENERPLLEVSNKAQRIQELLRFRKPFYERAADIKIDTSKLDISSAVEQIIKKVKEDESFSS